MTDPADHLWWITSRAAGIIALVLASLAVTAGLMMGLRMIRGKRAGDLRSLHEVLSLGSLVALVVHGLALLGDSYLHPSLVEILVPFQMERETFWVSVGIVGGWVMIILGLSYYARKAIGQARWRTLHRFTAVGWLMGVGHALGQGTDAGETWFLAITAVAVLPALVLLTLRMAGARESHTKSPATPAGVSR